MTPEARVLKLVEILGDNVNIAAAEFTMRAVESMVLQYINHETIPEGLDYTVILMAASYCRSSGLCGMDSEEGTVTKVKRGDTEISYGASVPLSANTFDLTSGSSFAGWRTTLDEYRKLRW